MSAHAIATLFLARHGFISQLASGRVMTAGRRIWKRKGMSEQATAAGRTLGMCEAAVELEHCSPYIREWITGERDPDEEN
jgi:hypothetical protein